MFSRNVVNQSVSNGPSNGRRAFRDVTNASRAGGGKGAKIAKRSTGGIKTRSMGIEPHGDVMMDRQSAVQFNNRMDDRNPAEDTREFLTLPRTGVDPDPSSYQVTGHTDNIDDRDSEDPLCVTDYVNEMYVYYRHKELETAVQPDYMDVQSHINERMRSILVDWLVEVHLKFKLMPETLYLTISLIDSFLKVSEVSRPRLQLVGVTCLLIASKYEEIYPPELRDLVYICDRAYTKNDILAMEENVLKSLNYNVTMPTAYTFLVRYLKAGHADKKIVQLACYLLDGTLQSYNLLNHLPSKLAASAVYVARREFGRNAWSPTLLKYSGYCEEEIIPVARAVMQEKVGWSTELRAVNKKYSSIRYGQVAHMDISSSF